MICGPSYVPVNADNDNGSAVPIGTGIPAQRDFSVAPINGPSGTGDPGLINASVVTNLPPGGAWSETLTQNGGGRISLWGNAKKSATFALPNGWTVSFTFYIEGTHESSASGDVTLQFTYTFGGIRYPSNVLQITVTPFLPSNGFTLTPGGAGGQNIFFTDGQDGTLGLQTETATAAGIVFSASVNSGGLSVNGKLVLIQNVEQFANGLHGTTDLHHAPAGFKFSDGTGANVMFSHALPLLDTVNATPSLPEYDSDVTTTNSNGTASITANDNPDTGHPAGSDRGVALDLFQSFRVWLAWKYPSGVYYPIAWANWQVDYYATASPNANVPPINTIQVIVDPENWTAS